MLLLFALVITAVAAVIVALVITVVAAVVVALDVVVLVVVSRGQGVALMTGITSLCFPVEAGTSLYGTFESIDKARTLTCTIKVL